MSRENVEIVRAIYDQWSEGNFRAGVELYDPGVALVQRPQFPEAGTYVGPEEVAGYMHTFLEAWSHVTIDAEELIDAGDSVVAAVIQRGVGRGSGADPDFRYFQVWTFRDGRVVRLEVIRQRDEALEAAGLSTGS
jgi:hypothetical protein